MDNTAIPLADGGLDASIERDLCDTSEEGDLGPVAGVSLDKKSCSRTAGRPASPESSPDETLPSMLLAQGENGTRPGHSGKGAPRATSATNAETGDPYATHMTVSWPERLSSNTSFRPEVPGYTILDELGRGGMGVVYKARQDRLNRLVALKMILAGAAAGDPLLERFRAEAEAVARLQHPHIVQIYDVGEVQGQPFLSLEYVDGGSLEKKMSGRPLTTADVAPLIEKLARAIHLAHERGIIHRDLKPANVLLAADGTPKITDFGLAKQMHSAHGRTQTGSILGTPSYMAPEQAGGRVHEITPATDVYALGAILYECTTGRPPFRAASAIDTVMQVMKQEPIAPSQFQAKLPPDLETICLKCLQKESHKRYASALDLAEDLHRFHVGEPIHARPVSKIERASRWCRRNPLIAISLALACVALIATAAVSTAFAFQQRQSALRLADAARQLQEKENQTEQALADSQESHRASRRQLALLSLERGLNYCEQNDEAHGMLWMTRALRDLPEGESNVHDVILTNLNYWQHRLHRLQAVIEQPGEVDALSLSPDGRSLLVATSAGKAILWSMDTERALLPPLEHGGRLRALAWSAGGDLIMTASDDHSVRLWSAKTGIPVGAALLHRSAVVAAVMSPDAQVAATADQDGTVCLWNVATGQQTVLPLPHEGAVHHLAISKNGQLLLTGGEDGVGRLWSVSNGHLIRELRAHHRKILAVAFSPDSKIAITGSGDGSARLWSVQDGTPISNPLQHEGPVQFLAFSPDGKLVATAPQDDTAHLWAVPTGRPMGQPLQHHGQITALAFSPQGDRILTGSRDNCARIWEATTGKPIGPPLQHRGSVFAVAWSRDGKRALTGSRDRTVRIWDTTLIEETPPIIWQAPNESLIGFSTDCRLALTRAGGGLRVTATNTGTHLGPPIPCPNEVQAYAISHDGRLLMTDTIDGTVQLWSVASGQRHGAPLPYQATLRAAAFRPDGKVLLTGSVDGTARLWDVETGEPLGSPLRHDDEIIAVAFSADGQRIATGGKDNVARVWSADTSAALTAPLPHQATVCAVEFAPDGNRLLTGSHDLTARLWDVRTGNPLGLPLEHDGAINDISFSPDGSMVLTGSEDRTARIWSANCGKPLSPPLEHRGKVVGVAFASDGRSFLTCCANGTVRSWPVHGRLNVPPEMISPWLSTLSGMELGEWGGLRILDASRWYQERRRLTQFSGVRASQSVANTGAAPAR